MRTPKRRRPKPIGQGSGNGRNRNRYGTSSAWTLAAISMALSAIAVSLVIWSLAWNGDQGTDLSELEAAVAELEINVTMPDSIVPQRIVYVDAGSGSDTNNDGLTPLTPVETLTMAISVMSEQEAVECIIQLQGNTTFELGNDPVLCVHPLQARCKYIRIKGVETIIGSGTVTAEPTLVDPTGRGWARIEDDSASFLVGEFEKKYIRNVNQSRIYVVDTNTNITIDSITGILGGRMAPLPDQAPMQYPWNDGDVFEVFEISNIISWTGTFVLDIVYNQVTFEAIHFSPSEDESRMRLSDGNQIRATFRGCQLDARSSNALDASYVGSILLLGVNIQGTFSGGGASFFTAFQANKCVQSESVWFSDVTSIYSELCGIFYAKITDSPGQSLIIAGGANFRMYGVKIENPGFGAILVLDGSTVFLQQTDIDVQGGFGTYAIEVNGGSHLGLYNTKISCGGASCVNGMHIKSKSTVSIQGNHANDAEQPFLVDLDGTLVFRPITNEGMLVPPALSGMGATNSPIQANAGSEVSLFQTGLWTLDLDALGNTASVISCNGCTLTFGGTAGDFTWTTASGVPLVSVTNGGIARGPYSGTLVNGNGVAGGTQIIKCGDNAISDWSVSENDFASGTTENCNCAR